MVVYALNRHVFRFDHLVSDLGRRLFGGFRVVIIDRVGRSSVTAVLRGSRLECGRIEVRGGKLSLTHGVNFVRISNSFYAVSSSSY